MTEAKRGDKVKVHYKGTLADGSTFDSSEGREPFQFTLGAGMVIPGFEEAVEGLKTGEERTVTIPARDAYGEHDPELVSLVGRDLLPDGLEPEVGMMLQGQGENGAPVTVTISEVGDETITVDANHPLAGKELTFRISLVEIG